MLDRIRTHAQGWIVKAILGSMTIGLIFYFGYSGLSRSGGKNASGGNIHAATVNGEIIPQKKLEALVQKQMEFYRQVNQGALPPALVESIKANALERLIENKLLAEQAKKIGMTVSDKELAQEITSNPQFIKDGVFNKKFYLEVVKPNYERQMGDDYETDLREEILVDKFETFIKNSIQLSDQELHDEFVQSQTQLNLLKITLDNTQWKDQPESAPKADNAKTEILNALKSPAPAKGPAPLDTLKKKYS
ncbi:MAG: SurA N-terminal domain-containing protein, partial [Deltaproteobacteria bacterium]|nr:SurA N-terminal domain-containing protein [Deltaproteobacteria bacterium]